MSSVKESIMGSIAGDYETPMDEGDYEDYDYGVDERTTC